MKKPLLLSLLFCLFSQSIIAQDPSYWQRARALPGRTYQWIKEHPKTSAAIAASLLATGGLLYRGMPKRAGEGVIVFDQLASEWTPTQSNQYWEVVRKLTGIAIPRDSFNWMTNAIATIAIDGNLEKVIQFWEKNNVSRAEIINRLKQIMNPPPLGEAQFQRFAEAVKITEDELRRIIEGQWRILKLKQFPH